MVAPDGCGPGRPGEHGVLHPLESKRFVLIEELEGGNVMGLWLRNFPAVDLVGEPPTRTARSDTLFPQEKQYMVEA